MATNREKFFNRHNIPLTESLSIPQISKLSGMPVGALKAVESKGRGAYGNNPQSVRMKGTFKKGVDAPLSQKISIKAWSYGRIYSFVMKQPGTFYGADRHIAEEYGLLKPLKK